MPIKKKDKKYRCSDITQEELDAIMAGEEQMRHCTEGSDEDYAKWAAGQIKLIRSFYKKVKIQ